MGSGSWTCDSFKSYASRKSYKLTDNDIVDLRGLHLQDMYDSVRLPEELNPKNVVRECCDSEEHPNTIPVILALDVTGSMGDAAMQVASKLNEIMTKLYKTITDIEFCVMGIGDLAYDQAPIQISQFESDIRIAESLDKVYFERGGGGNCFESYTAAWYMGLHHCKLDCWKRGKKGIIITLGDEELNPYLPKTGLSRATDDPLQADIETPELYEEVSKKYDVYHIFVEHSHNYYKSEAEETFVPVIGKEHYKSCGLNSIADAIIQFINKSIQEDNTVGNEQVIDETGKPINTEISW